METSKPSERLSRLMAADGHDSCRFLHRGPPAGPGQDIRAVVPEDLLNRKYPEAERNNSQAYWDAVDAAKNHSLLDLLGEQPQHPLHNLRLLDNENAASLCFELTTEEILVIVISQITSSATNRQNWVRWRESLIAYYLLGADMTEGEELLLDCEVVHGDEDCSLVNKALTVIRSPSKRCRNVEGH
jgi:hypothetical protein